jgi:Winged helix DNA-binding domain
MTRSDIARQRLINQHLSAARFSEPAKVVEWLAAVQAQDYAGAKWSLGLRLRAATDGDIERAFSEGAILRTHLLRPTWHFVTPADIRWMLALSAPRVHQANAYMYRKLGLDNAVFQRSNAALARALQEKQLIRDELREVLHRAGIPVDGEFRMGYLLMRAELDGIVCSGGRRGNQFTYALLDDRVPPSEPFRRDEALAELTRRYFRSRGPASIHDFAKWSGLTMTDARAGLEAVKGEFEHEVMDGQSHWFTRPGRHLNRSVSTAYLLSIYDEYVSGYKDHSAVIEKDRGTKLRALGNALTHIMVIDGQLAGTWKRSLSKNTVLIKLSAFDQLKRSGTQAVVKAARHYGEFHDLDVELS